MSTTAKKTSKTANLIQKAATELFSKKGYDGTIMDDLAGMTGANKASIYYYFKNKKGLYERCMTDLFASLANQVIDAVDAETKAEKKLARFILTFSEVAYQDKKIPASLMREMASGGENMPVSARKQMQRLVFCIKQILEQGVEQGVFVEVNPLTIHFLILGCLSFYITSEPLRKSIQSDDNVDLSVADVTQEIVFIIHNSLLVKCC